MRWNTEKHLLVRGNGFALAASPLTVIFVTNLPSIV